MNKILNFFRKFFFSFITNYVLYLTNRIYLKGEYDNWCFANKICIKGYYSKNIFEKVKKNFILSRKKKNYYERDGILLRHDYKIVDPIIKLIKFLGKKKRIDINVFDVGGGMGSIYFKYEDYIKKNKKISWKVYEQKKIVNFANLNINEKRLNFTNQIQRKYKNKFDIILLQSSIQYFPKPFVLLQKLISLNPMYIVISETCFSNKQKIKIQINPNKVSLANYPLYIFNEKKFIYFFKKKNFLLKDREYCLTGIGGYQYKSFIFKKNENKKKKI